jgi:hypothetical protein
MNVQNIFYIFGIIFMSLGIIVLIVISVVLVTIKQKISHLHDLVDEKMQFLNKLTNDPADIAINWGTKAATRAVKKVKDAINK